MLKIDSAAGSRYNRKKERKRGYPLRVIFDKEKLLILLRDFYELTGLRTVIFDEWGMDILSYPQELPAYCRLIRQTPEGELGCRHCDQTACLCARREGKARIYPCHAGLLEAITPILVDDVIVGYMLLSHIVQGADEKAEWQRARHLCTKYDIDEAALYAAYCQLPRTPYNLLRAACDLLSLSAQAICQAQMARLVQGNPAERLNRYLTEHLQEDLSSEKICEAMGMGRTALYRLAKQTYGCGVKEYLRTLRIRRAAELLVTTELTNSEICQQIGIADYNYFFRVFREQTGLTPQMYRRQLSGRW